MKKKNAVFYISIFLTLVIAIWSLAFQESFTRMANAVYQVLTTDFGWLYLVAMTFFVIFAAVIGFGKYGKIVLGPDDAKPEYSTFSWFAMLFGAGMGIGLVFWGIAEPLSHYLNPIPEVEPGTAEAAEFAIRSSFMHWGIHPWANYCMIGLALAYFKFRKNKPGLISTLFIPLLGEERVRGWFGKVIDILAVFATVAGVTTSRGLGVLQINSGLNSLFHIPSSLGIQLTILVVLSVIYIIVTVIGIDNGMKKLSDLNLYLIIAFLVAAFVVGPKIEIVNNLTNGIGNYIGKFFEDSLMINSYQDNSWVENWRIFYWAWWIAWAPFVGSFIARISRGRTIREFVLGVVLAPSLGSILWFAVFGTLGIHVGIKGILPEAVLQKIAELPETGLFTVLEQYPFASILCAVALLLLCTFFITSASSGTFVLSMFSEEGNLNPSNQKKIIWGIVQTILAAGLFIAGGIKPLQIISLAAAFPFIFIMIFAAASLLKALRQEEIK